MDSAREDAKREDLAREAVGLADRVMGVVVGTRLTVPG
jgi:hypothetical protein